MKSSTLILILCASVIFQIKTGAGQKRKAAPGQRNPVAAKNIAGKAKGINIY